MSFNRREFIKTSALGAAGFSLMTQNGFGGTNSFFNQSQIQLPFRQIHLDFHTSEMIENIAIDFNPDEFADVLDKARVNSINCFAKGHHGWLYYNTKKFAHLLHPHLKKKNLLNLQAEALKKKGIAVTAYVSLQTDYQTAKSHPEWRIVNPNGSLAGGNPGNASFWLNLCLNSPYKQYLQEQIVDVMENVTVDGFWLDIIKPTDCSCKWCKERMQKRGLDPSNAHDRMVNGEEVMIEFTNDTSAIIRKHNPNYLIYYNSGHVSPFHRKVEDNYSHFELESLSSSEKWGYPFFQNEARYVRTLGKDFAGMTGKFHSTWGDFHSFKKIYALEFDCFQSIALNGKCSIGDQLHPNGKIDKNTYELIGDVYKQVEQKEPWCEGAKAVSEIAVFSPEEFTLGIVNNHPTNLWGANYMMLEGGFQYDVIDTKADFSKYKLLILPDDIPVEGEFKTKLENYVKAGGKIIASYLSGMDKSRNSFIDLFGVEKAGKGPVDSQGKPVHGQVFNNNSYAQYIVPEGAIGKNLRTTEYVMHIRGLDVNAKAGSEVLLYNTLSYFDRRGDYFSSHLQTPSSGKRGLPAVIKKGNVIYFSHPVFKQYNENAAWWSKTLIHNAIDMLMPQRLVKTNGPTTLVSCLNEQPHKNRRVLHLLHYIPQKRGLEFQTIEDRIPLHNLEIELMTDKKVNSLTLVPGKEKLKFQQEKNVVKFVLPKLDGHQMIEIV